MKKFIRFFMKYRHMWILFYVFIYILWFRFLETTVTAVTQFHVMHTWVDDLIPFCPYFVVPYFAWFFYIFAVGWYLMIRNSRDFTRAMSFLFIGMTISLIICTIYPNGTDFRPLFDTDQNVFTRMVGWLYRTDTCTNVFPSVHVYNSIGILIAVLKSEDIRRSRRGRAVQIGCTILSALICISTVFLKQHSVVDVIGAVLLAKFVYGFVYGTEPALQPAAGRQPKLLAARVESRDEG